PEEPPAAPPAGQEDAPARRGTAPTLADVRYGPHARNVLDLWQARSATPSPLIVFIHGGGFVQGDKQVDLRPEQRRLRRALAHGVSFASIDYRLRTTATLDQILLDCARAVQFLRAHAAEWNLDPARVAAYGSSAGGGATLWLAVHDDLADPASEDPILQQSSRLAAAGHLNSQATYDCEQWAAIVGVPPTWLVEWSMGDDLEFYGVASRDQVDSPAAKAIRGRVDMLAFLDAGDPPLFVQNLNPDLPPRNREEVIHHPRHALHLAERCRAAGIEVQLVTAGGPSRRRPDVVDFLLTRLGKTPRVPRGRGGEGGGEDRAGG
ncbi:MAG: alpha/beta hydrolase, partial [Planctomycetota bacterium]